MMSAASILVILVTAPAGSLQAPLLRTMAHPDSAVAEYSNAGVLVRDVLGPEEAWEIAALLGTEAKSWSLPAIRAEWCAPPPKTEQRVHFAFHAALKQSVVLID